MFLGVTDRSEANIQAFSEKLSVQFRIPVEKALRIAKGAPMVVKKDISRSKAERYQQVFLRLGGQVRIEQTDGGIKDNQTAGSTGRVEGFETTAVAPRSSGGEISVPESQGQDLPRDQDISSAYDDAIAGAYEDSFMPPTDFQPKAPKASGFQCPQCKQEQEKGVECVRCGIIFEKYERMVQPAQDVEAQAEEEPTEPEQVPEDVEIKIEPAGFWIRLGAYIVDDVILILLTLLVGIVLAILLGVKRDPRVIASAGPLFNLIFLILPFAYPIYFLGNRGYTPGKGFLGLQVIRQDGTGMSYGDAAIRTFSYILSSIPFSLGFIWIAFDRNKQGWHDKIAKTQVIRAEEVSAWRKWVALAPVALVPIIMIVAAIGIPYYVKYSSRVDVATVWSELQTVKNHLEEHYYRHERYPLTGEFRSFLRGSLGRIPQDPFNHGRPYRYESDGSTFTLWSIGPDQEDDYALIPYDPLVTRSFRQKGDIIFYSDVQADQSGDLFEMTSEAPTQAPNFPE